MVMSLLLHIAQQGATEHFSKCAKGGSVKDNHGKCSDPLQKQLSAVKKGHVQVEQIYCQLHHCSHFLGTTFGFTTFFTLTF